MLRVVGCEDHLKAVPLGCGHPSAEQGQGEVMRVPCSQIKIRRPTLQAKKQEYFALVMTVATEVEFKMCSRHRDFFLRYSYNTPYKGYQTAWNPTTHHHKIL
jgi:hypothetical protein